jgi:hypothetical protein
MTASGMGSAPACPEVYFGRATGAIGGEMLFLALLACVEAPNPGHDTADSAGVGGLDSADGVTDDSGDTAPACPPLGAGGAPDASPPVIIGGGPAGLAAAIDLGDALLLESSTTLGGRAATFADWERMTGAPGNSSTLTMLEQSAAVKGRLEALGLTFDMPSADVVTGRRELFRALDDGPTMAARLQAALPAEVEVRLGLAAQGLVFDEHGWPAWRLRRVWWPPGGC